MRCLWFMAMNTFLSFFLTLVTFCPLGYPLPQCALVAVKIRFTICPGRELGSEVTSATCRSSPEPSNRPTGVPSWLSVGSSDDILGHRLYVVGKAGSRYISEYTVQGPSFRSDLDVTIRASFVLAIESGVWRRCWHCEQLLSFQT